MYFYHWHIFNYRDKILLKWIFFIKNLVFYHMRPGNPEEYWMCMIFLSKVIQLFMNFDLILLKLKLLKINQYQYIDWYWKILKSSIFFNINQYIDIDWCSIIIFFCYCIVLIINSFFQYWNIFFNSDQYFSITNSHFWIYF